MPRMGAVVWCCVLTLLVVHWAVGQKTEPRLKGLFRGSDHYDFAIVVPASGLECFWHFAHQSGNFYLTYMVQWKTGLATDNHLYVTVISPEGKLMASVEDTDSLINFQTETTGFYQLCLGNYKNHFGGVRVFVNFGVYYEGASEMRRRAEEGEKVLNNTVSNIETSTNRIQNLVIQMWRHYSYARMRKGADHYLLQSNYNYVTWWSAVQSAVIIMSGYLQLFFLKRLFNTPANKPRC